MTGKELQNTLKEKGINLSELADYLQLSPQNLNSKFKAKDIGVGFLRQIATGTKISLSEFLNIQVEHAAGQVNEPGIEYNSFREKYIECMEEKEGLYKRLLALQLEKEKHAAVTKK